METDAKNFFRHIFLTLSKNLAGLKGLQVATSLLSQGNLTAREISNQTGLILNKVRHMLSLLENQGMLYSFQKEKEGTNWTTYSWESGFSLVKRAFKQRLKSAILLLKEYAKAIEREDFRYCSNCDTYYNKTETPHLRKCKFCGSEVKNHSPKLPKEVISKLLEKYKQIS